LLFEINWDPQEELRGRRQTYTGNDAKRKKKSNTAHIIMKKPTPLLNSAVFVPKEDATPKAGVIIAPKLA
jgi:hypothetical protein